MFSRRVSVIDVEMTGHLGSPSWLVTLGHLRRRSTGSISFVEGECQLLEFR